jgi:hypothetical protein
MKKLFLLVLLVVGITTKAQTTIDLSGMTTNLTLGQNCSSSQTPQQYITTGDVNLNGKTLNLKNVILKVNGNINGGGRIEGCGQAKLNLTGVIQNNPQIEEGLLVTLGLQTFNLIKDIPKNLNYKVYDIMGRLIYQGNTNNIKLPIKQLIILKVEGYEPKKMILS